MGSARRESSYPIPALCTSATNRIGTKCFCSELRQWVNCLESICGESPVCQMAPLDNSPEACKRRLEYLRRNG